MPQVEAIREVRYAGKTYKAGETFTAFTEKDATALKLTKRAKDAPAAVPKTQRPPVEQKAPEPAVIPPVVETRAMTAETPDNSSSGAVAETMQVIGVDGGAEENKEQEPEQSEQSQQSSGSGRRGYRRRDMRPEPTS